MEKWNWRQGGICLFFYLAACEVAPVLVVSDLEAFESIWVTHACWSFDVAVDVELIIFYMRRGSN